MQFHDGAKCMKGDEISTVEQQRLFVLMKSNYKEITVNIWKEKHIVSMKQFKLFFVP